MAGRAYARRPQMVNEVKPDPLTDAVRQARKRGPKPRLERQLESIGNLPRNQQQKILAVVEAFIAQHAEP